METSPKIPLITTQRLVLRPFSMADLAMLKPIVQEPDIFHYFPNQDPWTDEKTEGYIQYQINHWHLYGYGHWALVRNETGQIIGWNGLEFLPDTNETEVGYLLSKAFWGKGYATEAAIAAIQFGIKKIKLNEIIGLTHPENIASQRVLEKCGFSFTRSATYFGMEMFRFATQV